MKAILVQLSVVWENRTANFDKVRSLLAGRRIEADSLIVLPEMFATGFSMNLAATVEADESETEAFMTDLARTHQSHVLGGVVRAGHAGRGRNEAVVFNPVGQEVARYCKLFPFSLSGEDQHYEKGENVVYCEVGGFVLSPFICYDLRFPEAFRLAARRGAELMPVIAQWPSRRTQHWIDLLKARAIENQAYVLGVNRCGADPKLEYDGRSLVVDPHGKVIADAGGDEGILEADLDPEVVRHWRADFPALKDMREDLPS